MARAAADALFMCGLTATALAARDWQSWDVINSATGYKIDNKIETF
jgi:hypothetical protein